MTIEESIQWIHERLKFGSRPGLARVEKLASLFGNPQNKLKVVHVAGTNGKGSTVAFLRNILQQHQLKIGTFTSPFIESFNERISINGLPIADEDLVELVQRAQVFVSEMDRNQKYAGITEFELITVLALEHFVKQKVDVAIIEVGLGGLLDSTNIVKPSLTSITTIGLDHQEILGETIEEIAFQKAGILKEGVPLVLGNVEDSAKKLIEELAHQKNVTTFSFQKDYFMKQDQELDTFQFSNTDHQISSLQTTMIGSYQKENAVLAIQLALLLFPCLSTQEVQQGIIQTFWAGRMEKLCENPLIYVDGAHNEPAIKKLCEVMEEKFPTKKRTVLFSALTTKDISKMVELLSSCKNTTLTLTTFEYPKAMTKDDVANLTKKYELDFVDNWQQYLKEVQENDVILVTGSLYFISEVRKVLKK